MPFADILNVLNRGNRRLGSPEETQPFVLQQPGVSAGEKPWSSLQGLSERIAKSEAERRWREANAQLDADPSTEFFTQPNEVGSVASGFADAGYGLLAPLARLFDGESANQMQTMRGALAARREASIQQAQDEGMSTPRAWVNRNLPGAVSSITQAGTIGGNLPAAARSAGLALGFGVTTADQAYTDAINAGLDPAAARDYALRQGGIEGTVMGGFEAAGAVIPGAGGFERRFVDGMVGGPVARTAAGGALQYAKDFGRRTAGELAEELTTSGLQAVNTAQSLPGRESEADLTGEDGSFFTSPLAGTAANTIGQTLLTMGLSETPYAASRVKSLLTPQVEAFLKSPSQRNFSELPEDVKAEVLPEGSMNPPNRSMRAAARKAIEDLLKRTGVGGNGETAVTDPVQVPGDEAATIVDPAAAAVPPVPASALPVDQQTLTPADGSAPPATIQDPVVPVPPTQGVPPNGQETIVPAEADAQGFEEGRQEGLLTPALPPLQQQPIPAQTVDPATIVASSEVETPGPLGKSMQGPQADAPVGPVNQPLDAALVAPVAPVGTVADPQLPGVTQQQGGGLVPDAAPAPLPIPADAGLNSTSGSPLSSTLGSTVSPSGDSQVPAQQPPPVAQFTPNLGEPVLYQGQRVTPIAEGTEPGTVRIRFPGSRGKARVMDVAVSALQPENSPAASVQPEIPPVQSGMVRMYHGGEPYAGGPRWLTPDPKYAEGYATKNGRKDALVYYVDLPADSPYLQPSFDDTGLPYKAPPLSFDAPDEIASQLKPYRTIEQVQAAYAAESSDDSTLDPDIRDLAEQEETGPEARLFPQPGVMMGAVDPEKPLSKSARKKQQAEERKKERGGLANLIIERGGISPDYIRKNLGGESGLKDLKEEIGDRPFKDKYGKHGTQRLDTLARSLVDEGEIPPPPADMNVEDWLLHLVRNKANANSYDYTKDAEADYNRYLQEQQNAEREADQAGLDPKRRDEIIQRGEEEGVREADDDFASEQAGTAANERQPGDEPTDDEPTGDDTATVDELAEESAEDVDTSFEFGGETEVEKPQRFVAGKALSEKERKSVLDSIGDVYREAGLKKDELKGEHPESGDERFGYPYRPDLFVTSDITGKKIRHYVTLPDGKKAHPSELFPSMSQAEIDRRLDENEHKRRESERVASEKNQRIAKSKSDANYKYNSTNRSLDGSYFAYRGDEIVRVDGNDEADITHFTQEGFKKQSGTFTPAGVPGEQKSLFNQSPDGQKQLFNVVKGGKREEQKPTAPSELEKIEDDLKQQSKRNKPLDGQTEFFDEPAPSGEDAKDADDYSRAPAKFNATRRRDVGPDADSDSDVIADDGLVAVALGLPELIELAENITGNTPQMGHQLRTARGVFKAIEGSWESKIYTRPDIATDVEVQRRVTAHEIGHAIDFNASDEAPAKDLTMSRGNILGRLGSLFKYLKTTISEKPGTANSFLTPQERQALRRQARKELGKDAESEQVTERYRELVEAEIERRGLVTTDIIRSELLELTEWWRPYDKDKAPESYVKYRESSEELFADAMSVLLNAPDELSRRAPVFYEAFAAYLERKPEVADELFRLWDLSQRSPEEIAAHRRVRIEAGQRAAEVAARAAYEARHASTRSLMDGLRHTLNELGWTALVDRLTPLKNRARAQGNAAAEYMIDELYTVDSPQWVLATKTDREVLKPLLEAGVSNEEIGEYLFVNRIVNEVGAEEVKDDKGVVIKPATKARFELANPYGFDRETAKDQLDALEKKLGPEKWKALEDRMRHWHREILWPIVEDAVRSGVYSQDNRDRKLEPNKDVYAAFSVLQYITDQMSPMIKEQVGTFDAIGNPFQFTTLKFLSLIRLNQLNKVKMLMVDRLLPKTGEVRGVEVPHGAREPVKKAADGNEYLPMLRDGKLEWYEVPAAVAESFKTFDPHLIAQIGRVISSATYSLFHPLFVTFSPGFLASNPFRDLSRTWRNLGALKNISFRDVFKAWWKALPAARRYAVEGFDADVMKLIENKAFGVSFSELTSAREEVVPFLPGMNQTETGFRKWVSDAKNPASKFLRSLERLGQMQEVAMKLAADKVLEEAGVTDDRERAFIVRKYAGTPDWKQKGQLTDITNSLWLYSKVKWNALQADAQLATRKDTAAGFWWRQAVTSILPTTLFRAGLYGALAGIFGDDLEKRLKAIPSYLRDAYLTIPLPWNRGTAEDPKTDFITIPRDENSQMIASLWGHILDTGVELAGGKSSEPGTGAAMTAALGDMFAGVLPSWNPSIELAHNWYQYGTGENPRDSHSGQEIIPRGSFEAGMTERGKKMLQWSWDKTGALSQLTRFASGRVFGSPYEDREETWTESAGIGAMEATGLSRIVRVGATRGLQEWEWNEVDRAKQQKALERLENTTPAVRRLNSELSKLQQIPDLDDAQWLRKTTLSLWQSRHYDRTMKEIKRVGDEAGSTLVEELDASARTLANSRELPDEFLGSIVDLASSADDEKTRKRAQQVLIDRGVTLSQAKRMLLAESHRQSQQRENSIAEKSGRRARRMPRPEISDAMIRRIRVLSGALQ